MAKVGVVYLCWSNEPRKYLPRVLDALTKQTQPKEATEIFIVYNSRRPDEPSAADFIFEAVAKRTGQLPRTEILIQEKNLGFPAGNNLGVEKALAAGCDYVFLHNADGWLAPNALAELVVAMEGDKTIGQGQPLILLEPENDLINSAGNARHYLGIGYCLDYRRPAAEKNRPPVSDVGYVSGAAAILRADLLRRHGPLSEKFFLYHEDTEYSLRLRTLGFRAALISRALFYHQFEYKKNPAKFFWIERNRRAVQLMFYRWPTLILLAPPEIFWNLVLIPASLFGGWLGGLFRVWGYWLKPSSWRFWLAERQKIQSQRKISDRELLAGASSWLEYGAAAFVLWPLNLLFTLYGFLLKITVWW